MRLYLTQVTLHFVLARREAISESVKLFLKQ